MKQITFGKIVSVVTCVLLLCVSVSTPTAADQAHYIYDDLGRLSQVIDGQGNVATYTYDAVGNLLSTTRSCGDVSLIRSSDETREALPVRALRRCGPEHLFHGGFVS
jgi:YD repeat-containing protein